jgi:hypothetical protein
VILRLARFTLARDQQNVLVETLRHQAKSKHRPDGLEDLIFARSNRGPDQVEFVIVTLWSGLAAVKRALGSAWQLPGGLGGLAERMVDASVEHFEVFADDWPEVLDFLAMSPDERWAAVASNGRHEQGSVREVRELAESRPV